MLSDSHLAHFETSWPTEPWAKKLRRTSGKIGNLFMVVAAKVMKCYSF